MSVLTSPQDSNFDDIKLFCPKIAEALGMNAAVMIQQLHYWTNKQVGVVVEGKRYIYNTYKDWTKEQFSWLSPYQFRKHMAKLRSLGIVEVIRYRKQQYNQTNYYHLNYDCLYEYLNWDKPENLAAVDVCETTHRDNKECLIGLAKTATSYTKTKSKENQQKETAKQKKKPKKNKIAAATPEQALEEEKCPQQENICPPQLTAPPSEKEPQSEPIQQKDIEEKSPPEVDQIVNKKWEKLIPDLDAAGIPINQTVTNLLKLYPKEQVEGAIALVKARKREQHIPNVAGYFVAAVKQDWASKKVVESTEKENDIDSASVFRHWYDLAKELGYCSGQEMRDGDQWVCLAGSWEKWENAVARGYSLEYLKKIIKRNRS